MGKQAKKKQKTEAQSKDQKKHNRATRGCNTKRRPRVWDTRQEVYKDKDGNEQTRTIKIKYPNNTQWDWTLTHDAVVDDMGITRLIRRKPEKQKPLLAPFDTLLDDTWEDDLRCYAEDNDAKVERTSLGDGYFRYEVWRDEFNQMINKRDRKILLTVDNRRKSRSVKSKRKKFSRKKR